MKAEKVETENKKLMEKIEDIENEKKQLEESLLTLSTEKDARIKTFGPLSIFELRFGSVQIKYSEVISTSLTPSCLYLRCTLQLTFSTTMLHNKFRLHSKDALCENLKSVIWVSCLSYVMIFSIDVSFEEKM